MLHAGGSDIDESNLALIVPPPPTETWFPVSHSSVLDATRTTLQGAGFAIAKQRLAVSHEGHRFFGVLDLTSPIAEGISLAVGIRNSTDKTFPIGFACGNRVFCCDNLAFTSEIVIAKKHTRYGETRFLEGIAGAVQGLGQYQQTAARWIQNLRDWQVPPVQADSIILRAYETEVIGARTLPLVIDEWRNPSFEEFRDGSAWSLWNCFTTVLGRTMQAKKPAEAALTTIRLQRLLTPEVIDGEATPTIAT